MLSVRKKKINKGLVYAVFCGILVPTILTNLVTAVSSFADTIIVGNFLGDTALSAVTINIPIFMLINTIAAMLAVGGATTIGVLVGKGDKQSANKVFSTAVSFGLLISVIMTSLGLIFIDNVVAMLGASGDITKLVEPYAIVIISFIPAFVLNTMFAFFVRNDGRPKLAMTGMLSAIGINIIFDIVFVGPCNIGIAGAAWAMVLSQVVSVIIISTHFFSKKNTLRYKISFNIKMLARIIQNGISTSMTFIYQLITMLVLNHMIMNIAGVDGMVIYTVVFNINIIAMSIFEGLSQTIQPIISVYHGEHNQTAIKNTMKYAIRIGAIICIVVISLLEIFPQSIAFLFGVTGGSLLEGSIIATRIVAPAMIFMTINVLFSYYFQSKEIRSIPFVIVICRNLIVLLIGIVLMTSIFEVTGIWISYIFTEVVTIAIAFVMVKVIANKDKSLYGLLLLKKDDKSYYNEISTKNVSSNNLEKDLKEYFKTENVSQNVQKTIIDNINKLNNAVVLENKDSKKKINMSVFLDVRGKNIDLEYWYTGKIFEPKINFGSGIESSYLTVLAKNRITVNYEV